MMGSFSENVLPLIASSIDDTVEPETSDDNDVTNDETDDEPNDETDWTGTEIGDDVTDLEMIDIPEKPTEPMIINYEAVDSDINDGYDQGYEDEYNYGAFKVQFISISMLLLTIAF